MQNQHDQSKINLHLHYTHDGIKHQIINQTLA